VCDLDVMGAPSKLSVIRKVATLEREPGWIVDLPLEDFEICFVYYESIKRELKIKPIYECRCDERLQTKTKRFTRLSYTGLVEIVDPPL
jgi:hypothetical protein